MRVGRLLRFELTVADLDAAEAFYAALPGVTVERRDRAEPAMAALLGVERIEQVWLGRGGQTILLQQFYPPGAPYPSHPSACDQAFQHLALPVADARAAVAGLPTRASAISRDGAQQLPPQSGGAMAYKFRDPDGHPLEFIQFADGHLEGVDHSAIVSVDVGRSIAFYRDELGLAVASRQTNRGPDQEALDDLPGAIVDVVALQPATPTPHVELLAYSVPPVKPCAPHAANDIAATRLVLVLDTLPMPSATLADGTRAALIHDPDGHLLLLVTV